MAAPRAHIEGGFKTAADMQVSVGAFTCAADCQNRTLWQGVAGVPGHGIAIDRGCHFGAGQGYAYVCGGLKGAAHAHHFKRCKLRRLSQQRRTLVKGQHVCSPTTGQARSKQSGPPQILYRHAGADAVHTQACGHVIASQVAPPSPSALLASICSSSETDISRNRISSPVVRAKGVSRSGRNG